MKTKIIYVSIILAMFVKTAWSQTTQRSFLKLTNKEGLIITQNDTVVSKKFFESAVITLQSDETIPRGSEIMLMLGEIAYMFDNPMLSPSIKGQIMKAKPNTRVVFSIQQKTSKELKFRLIE